MKARTIKCEVSREQTATILAALTFWNHNHYYEKRSCPKEFLAISTNLGSYRPLGDYEVPELIHRVREGDGADHTLVVTHREHGTVLAALRAWQREIETPLFVVKPSPERVECDAIATCGGNIARLSGDDIDVLCEYLN